MEFHAGERGEQGFIDGPLRQFVKSLQQVKQKLRFSRSKNLGVVNGNRRNARATECLFKIRCLTVGSDQNADVTGDQGARNAPFFYGIYLFVKQLRHLGHNRGNHLRTLAHLKYRNRSEERRVGKECRSRWSPY